MKLQLLDSSESLSITCVCLTYHSFSKIISTGLEPLSLTGISCNLLLFEDSFPDSSRILIASFLASKTLFPTRGPDISVIFPSKSMAANGFKPSSLNIETSFWSPKEHTIKIPLPKSDLTEGCVIISTVLDLSPIEIGNLTFFPTRCLYLSSSG